MLLAAAALALAGCSALRFPTPSVPPTSASPGRPLARLQPTVQGPTFTMYLPRLFEDESLGLRGVPRATVEGRDPTMTAIEALIRGPDGDERADDFEYPLDPQTRVVSLAVVDSTAMLELDAARLQRVHGRPFSELAYWSIVYTLTELPGVERVTLLQDGQPVAAFGSPPITLRVGATRADAPAWARPR
jgi:spore germination protein GerM